MMAVQATSTWSSFGHTIFYC